MQREENTFEDEKIAEEWINSVENEKKSFRDKLIYPKLSNWILKIKPKLIIEIGSGQGICSSKVNLADTRYIGIEPSKVLVNRANELYKRDNVNFLIGNTYDIPIESKSIDGVFSVMVWFHLENLNKAASEISRVLKKDGSFFIITSNPSSYKKWEKSFINFERHENKMVGPIMISGVPMTKSIIYTHTIEELEKSFENNGLKIDKINEFGNFWRGKLFISIEGKSI